MIGRRVDIEWSHSIAPDTFLLVRAVEHTLSPSNECWLVDRCTASFLETRVVVLSKIFTSQWLYGQTFNYGLPVCVTSGLIWGWVSTVLHYIHARYNLFFKFERTNSFSLPTPSLLQQQQYHLYHHYHQQHLQQRRKYVFSKSLQTEKNWRIKRNKSNFARQFLLKMQLPRKDIVEE